MSAVSDWRDLAARLAHAEAERDALRATVARVEALAEFYERDETQGWHRQAARDLRAALTPATGPRSAREAAEVAGEGEEAERASGGDSEALEHLAHALHDAYEAAAIESGWETQERSRKPWADVPDANKETMRRALTTLLADPGPLLAALAEAGVLTSDYRINNAPAGRRMERRYVTDWRPADA